MTSTPNSHMHKYLELLLTLAKSASEDGLYPTAAVVVAADGRVVGTGQNKALRLEDPTAHAEVMAIRDAGSVLLQRARDEKFTLLCTWEPCLMCLGAIVKADIAAVVWVAKGFKKTPTQTLHRSRHLSNRWGRLRLIGEPDLPCARELRALHKAWVGSGTSLRTAVQLATSGSP
jgi:tRNA(Arg) A34 adenosine deaminase TadA